MEWSFSAKSSNSSHQLLSFKVSSQDDVSSKKRKQLTTMSNTQGFTEKFSGTLPSSSRGHHQSFLPSPEINGLTASTMNRIVLPCNHVVGFTEIRTDSKMSKDSTQLTIFYDGEVCVYDNISPNKAKAIMLLAGNDHSIANKIETQTLKSPYLSLAETVVSVPSQVESHQKSIGSPHFKKETSTNHIPMVAVPQARKASLARFLEKRKERVLNVAPYMRKQSLECKSPP